MAKRKRVDFEENLKEKIEKPGNSSRHGNKKHTLDSDEEDSNDEDQTLDQELIEGEEETTTTREGEISITPFNMKEEMEEGHFDTTGHYHWKKEKEIKDGWLDNIDWVKIKGRPEDKYKVGTENQENDPWSESDSETEETNKFDLTSSYKEILTYMKPAETIQRCIQRLGASTKISSAERWKRKKAGIVDPAAETVTKLTSIVNEVMTKTGNMDIYQETFEKVKSIIEKAEKSNQPAELDMYADDFDSKEKNKMTVDDPENKPNEKEEEEESKDLMWEFKWGQGNEDQVHGPHTSEQMHKWVTSGYFKKGVWVRKCGQGGSFYTSNRIDFDLYI